MKRTRRTLMRRVTCSAACAIAMLAAAGAALAADITISKNGDGYDVIIAAEVPAADVVRELATASGAAVKGDPDQDAVAPNRLTAVSLHAALSRLLPHKAFVIELGETPADPATIIFLRPRTSNEAPMVVTANPALSAIAAGQLVPVNDRAKFVNALPMLRTK